MKVSLQYLLAMPTTYEYINKRKGNLNRWVMHPVAHKAYTNEQTTLAALTPLTSTPQIEQRDQQ
jgi:hypothetical protein